MKPVRIKAYMLTKEQEEQEKMGLLAEGENGELTNVTLYNIDFTHPAQYGDIEMSVVVSGGHGLITPYTHKQLDSIIEEQTQPFTFTAELGPFEIRSSDDIGSEIGRIFLMENELPIGVVVSNLDQWEKWLSENPSLRNNSDFIWIEADLRGKEYRDIIVYDDNVNKSLVEAAKLRIKK